MPDPTPGSTATVEPPVVTPPVTPPPVVTPPAAPPETPPAPPATPPAPTPGTPPATPPSAPEAFELEVPKDGLLTKDYVTQFQKDAIAAGLSKDEAKDLLDTQYKAVKEFDSRSKESIETAKKSWLEMSKTDPEIGGDNLTKTAEISKRVVERFGTDAFKKLLNDTGFGNYPEVLRFLSKVGSAFSEDQLRSGAPSSGGTPQKSREEILFANSTAGK